MTDYNYEAVVEYNGATVTFRGDEPMTVSAQAGRLPSMIAAQSAVRGVEL